MDNTVKGVEIDPVREKLIELFLGANQMIHLPYGMDTEQATKYVFGKMADHLIANGVTVQKWIPVTERLPEKSDFYICYIDGKYVDSLPYSAQHKLFNAFDGGITGHAIAVTHWMPLPEPPKEG